MRDDYPSSPVSSQGLVTDLEKWALERIKSSPLASLRSSIPPTPEYDKIWNEAIRRGAAADLESLLESSIANKQETKCP